MRFSTLYFLSFLFVLTPLYAETETLTTYYPSPSGNYNKIQTNFLQFTATTLGAVQEHYKCSYEPLLRLPSCPAGIIFYNTDTHSLYISDGTHWGSVVSSCIPLSPCSARLNCSTNDCGISCGACSDQKSCSSSIPGTPGTCS